MKEENYTKKSAMKNDLTTSEQEESQMIIDLSGVCISKKPRKDGRFQGYITKDGIKKYVYGRSRDDVEKKIKEYLQSGIPQKKRRKKDHSPTLSEWLDKWLELYKKPNLKPNSYILICNVLLQARTKLGKKLLHLITAEELQAFLISMKAPRMRDLCLTYLSQAFRKAFVLNLIKRNPCDALEIKRATGEARHALTRLRQKLFRDAIRENKYEPLCVLLMVSGARIGELLALTPRDVDREKKMIFISKNVIFIKGKKILQSTPKTAAGTRCIPIPQEALDLLPLDGDPDKPIFNFSYNSVRLFFKRLSEKLGFTVTAHILRHTYATRLEEAGISPKVVQYLMGHASLKMTKGVYTDVQEDYIINISTKLNGIFDT